MNGWIVGVIIVAAFVVGVGFMLYRKTKHREANDAERNTLSRALEIMDKVTPVNTPSGWNVYFGEGTKREGFSLAACDAGIENSFAKAACAGYAVDRTRHRINIVVLPSFPDSQGDPAFKMKLGHSDPYRNSPWDQATCPGDECEHWIKVAGAMVTIGEPHGDTIVIPHHSGQEDHLARICDYEAEHFLLARHDGPRFEDTKYHIGSGHPILAECAPTGARFVAPPPFTGLCLKPTK